MREYAWALPLILILAGALHIPPVAIGGEITPEGRRLEKALDDMNVERLWLATHPVNWKSGESLGTRVAEGRTYTHCSAFVAAASMRQGIYILRPPEHSTIHLADAQFDWLLEEGREIGWKPVSSAREAQQLANEGFFVVATFKEQDDMKAGHIAVARPSTKSDIQIDAEGPQIIQAGKSNLRSASLKEGFKHHPAAWKDGKVRYFAHRLNWK